MLDWVDSKHTHSHALNVTTETNSMMCMPNNMFMIWACVTGQMALHVCWFYGITVHYAISSYKTASIVRVRYVHMPPLEGVRDQ